MPQRWHSWNGLGLSVAAGLLLASCGGAPPASDPAPGPGPGPAPGPATPASPAEPVADSRGVITYPDYQVVIAREGDTLDSIAARIGIGVGELASYNGLPANWRPRAGDTLVIPPEARLPAAPAATAAPATADATAPGTPAWSPEIVARAIDGVPEPARPAPEAAPAAPLAPGFEETPAPATAAPSAPAAPVPARDGVEPVAHVVEPGETIYSISRLYGVPVAAIAAWNGLGRDYTLRPGQTIQIPLSAPAPGEASPVSPPPSAADPLPANPPVAARPASPQLDRYRSTAPASARLLRPVEGPVLRPYRRSGSDRNDGIDIAAPAGTPVLAAEAGEVALISNSLGNLGKIVLIRHADGLTTVYGRIDNVSVQKGDMVARGQPIGTVAATDPPALHFEVRRGAESVDPADYL
ncbi:MAG: peptidase M23 [Paracoccaceae bacterium]|nr:MAG: peptidase M23 [Paracoccaceae bacterium]